MYTTPKRDDFFTSDTVDTTVPLEVDICHILAIHVPAWQIYATLPAELMPTFLRNPLPTKLSLATGCEGAFLALSLGRVSHTQP